MSNDDGSISYESRSELDVPVEILNITEKQRFMDGDKVAILFILHLCTELVWASVCQGGQKQNCVGLGNHILFWLQEEKSRP